MPKPCTTCAEGALSSLLGRLQLFDYRPKIEGDLKTVFVLTRDHLKIMRSALVDLNEPRRQTDRRLKAHDMGLILDKWHEAVVGPQWRERSVRLEIDCRYEGPLTECCLESASIDRIFHNVVHHVSRHAVDGQPLAMTVFPVPGAPDGGCLRFVLAAEVNAAHVAHLRALVPLALGPCAAEFAAFAG